MQGEISVSYGGRVFTLTPSPDVLNNVGRRGYVSGVSLPDKNPGSPEKWEAKQTFRDSSHGFWYQMLHPSGVTCVVPDSALSGFY